MFNLSDEVPFDYPAIAVFIASVCFLLFGCQH